jgi:hypothetical protein
MRWSNFIGKTKRISANPFRSTPQFIRAERLTKKVSDFPLGGPFALLGLTYVKARGNSLG